MSLGIYPVFEPKLRGTKFEALGEVLAHNLEALDRVAEAANRWLGAATAELVVRWIHDEDPSRIPVQQIPTL